MTNDLDRTIVQPAADQARDGRTHRVITGAILLLMAFCIALTGLFFVIRSQEADTKAELAAVTQTATSAANAASALKNQVVKLGGVPVASPPEPGAPGLNGAQGPRGEQGLIGPQGMQGVPGIQGVMGAMGIAGADGKSVVGPQGVQGVKGDTGAACDPAVIPACVGPQGATGPAGPRGDTVSAASFQWRDPAVGTPGTCVYAATYQHADGSPAGTVYSNVPDGLCQPIVPATPSAKLFVGR